MSSEKELEAQAEQGGIQLNSSGRTEGAITEESLEVEPNGNGGEAEPLVKVEKKKPETVKSANIFQLFRYAGALDAVLLVIGVVAAVSHGASLPLSVLFFGQFTNAFIEQQFSQSICDLITPTLMDNTTTLSMKCDTIYSGVQFLANITGAAVSDCNSVLDMGFNSSLDCPTVLGLFNVTIGEQGAFITEVNKLALIFVALGVGVFIVALTQVFTFQTVAERQVHQIRIRFYRAVLRQEIAWFDEHPTGELANRLSDDVTKIIEGIGDKFALLIQLLSSVIAGFVIAFAIEWRLTLFMIAFTPFMIAAGGVLSKLTSTYASKEQTAYAKAASIAEEVLSSIRTVISFGGEHKELDRYNEELKFARKLGAKKGFSVGISLAFIFFLLFAVYGCGFWFGGFLVQMRFARGGDIIAAFFSVVIGAFSLGQAGPHIENLVVAAGAAGAIFQTNKRKPLIDSSSKEGLKPEKFDSTIELKNVSFNYPTRPDVKVLDNLSLKVDVGQTVALVGPSGCGKSTVVSLIERFYDVDGGEVLVGGERVDKLNIKWLRDNIGVVSQEPVLFDTTIAENIRYGQEDASMEDIEQAARSANAHEFVSQLPDGYNTLTGERGAQLSGGQKQRIAIARALVRNPKILLLDEATSALDTQSESVVQEALDHAREGRTTIVIAHRLSTIQNADVIASIEDGRVAEVGTHADLMARKGLYFDLVNAQSYGTDEAFIRGGLDRLYSRSNSHPRRSHKESESEAVRQLSSVTEEAKISDLTEEQIKELDKDIPTVPLTRLLRQNAKEWWLIVLGVLGATVNGSIFPIYAILFGEVLRVFGLDPSIVVSSIHPWAALYLALGVISGTAIMLKVVCFTVSGENLTARLRSISFQAMLRQEVGWFDNKRNSSGALTTRLAQEAALVQGATGSRVGSLVETTVGLLLAIVIAFVYSWLMTLVVLGVVPVLIIAGSLKVKALSAKNASVKLALEEAGRISIDSIDNIRTVAALGAEENFYQQYVNALKLPYRRALYFHPTLYGLIYAFPASVVFVMYAVVFRFGAFLTSQPRDSILFVSFFNVFRVLFALIFGAFSVGQASAFAPNYAKARLAANRIFFLIDRKPLIDNYSKEGQKLEKVSGALSVDSVDFNYPSRPDVKVLQELSVTVKPGQTLALVGPSGCGKSTVVSLIERFYDPSAGALKLEDVDLRDLNLRWLRSQVGIVSQEPVLFDCSIAENIRYGALFREVSDEEVIEAAKSANIHSFIESLPQGYSTNVGAKGTQLSGGQKQRIAIARALIRDPKVLLLDEATSALDTESEKVVQEALDKAREGRTSIVIAHRLSTIYNSDLIAVINRGRVEESGTHAQLIAARGLYYKLNRFQMVVEQDEEFEEL